MTNQYFDSISEQIIHTLGCAVNKKAKEINDLRISSQALRKKLEEATRVVNRIEVESKQLTFNHHEQSKKVEKLLETNAMIINELESEREHSQALQKALDKSKQEINDLKYELELATDYPQRDFPV